MPKTIFWSKVTMTYASSEYSLLFYGWEQVGCRKIVILLSWIDLLQQRRAGYPVPSGIPGPDHVKCRKYDSITPELIALHWLPIQQDIKFKVLLLVYKAHHKQSPSYISDLFQLQPTCRQLRSSLSSSHFIVCRTRHVSFWSLQTI